MQWHGWDTALQARRLQVRFPVESLGFFHIYKYCTFVVIFSHLKTWGHVSMFSFSLLTAITSCDNLLAKEGWCRSISWCFNTNINYLWGWSKWGCITEACLRREPENTWGWKLCDWSLQDWPRGTHIHEYMVRSIFLFHIILVDSCNWIKLRCNTSQCVSCPTHSATSYMCDGSHIAISLYCSLMWCW